MSETASTTSPLPADLPDPLAELDTATAAEADALLQQLAGDEVDRLLAMPPSTPLVSPVQEASAAPAPAIDLAPATLPDAPSPPEPVRPADPDEAALEAATTSGSSAAAHDSSEAVAAELTAALQKSAAHEYEPIEAAKPVPALLKPLVWLNAPLAGLSDSSREAIGTIAVVTAMNAAAVLVYVLFFRHH
jgi:hypothetical protein